MDKPKKLILTGISLIAACPILILGGFFYIVGPNGCGGEWGGPGGHCPNSLNPHWFLFFIFLGILGIGTLILGLIEKSYKK